MAASISVPVSPPNRKARLNPARRKAAKAKGTGQVLQSDPVAVTTTAAHSSAQNLNLNLSAKAGKPVPPPARLVQASIPQQKTAIPKRQLQFKQIASAHPTDDRMCRPDEYNAMKLAALGAPAVVTGGLVGSVAGIAIFLGAGLWSQIAGTDSAILAARTSKMVVTNLVDELIASLKAGTYNAAEALDMLRRTTLAYASTIPGGTAFVERLFHEIDVVRRQRGVEIDRVLAETCKELANARQRGANANEMHVTVLRQLSKLSAFTSNATQDILARNPGLRSHLPTGGKQKKSTVRLDLNLRHKRTAAAAK